MELIHMPEFNINSTISRPHKGSVYATVYGPISFSRTEVLSPILKLIGVTNIIFLNKNQRFNLNPQITEITF